MSTPITKPKNMYLLVFFLLQASSYAFAQDEIPVDLYHGTPQITVPIWTIKGRSLSDAVQLVYEGKGLKGEQADGEAGQGWILEAGGSIEREVRSLPDDYNDVSRHGWLYSANGNLLPNTSDISAATCDESNDNDQIALQTTFNITDTEPDIFSFQAPGLSGKFVFDNSPTPQIRLIPYQDIKIDIEFMSPTDKTIRGITITNNHGVRYSFGGVPGTGYPSIADSETRYTKKRTPENSVEYTKTDFDLYDSLQYINPPSYKINWKLVRTISQAGDELDYYYLNHSYEEENIIHASIKGAGALGFQDVELFSDHRSGMRYYPSSVSSPVGTSMTFFYMGPNQFLIDYIQVSDSRRPSGGTPFRKFDFSYWTANDKNLLASIQESYSGTTKLPYKFEYYQNSAPAADNKGLDFWGYFNGQYTNASLAPKVYVYPDLDASERYRLYPIPGYGGTSYTLDGANRTPDATFVKYGSLISITNPLNAKTAIDYEINTFYDPVAATNYAGPGIRIKSVTYQDQFNPGPSMKKSFTYNEPGGNSSGRIVHYPAFAVSTQQYLDPLGTDVVSFGSLASGLTAWSFLTVRLEYDLYGSSSWDDEAVGYKIVNVSREGAGHTQYEFLVPATYQDAATGDWTPTVDKFARPYPCPSMEIVTAGGRWSFPFAPDPNYDHERGLISKVKEFNQANVLVRETDTDYQYLYASGTAPEKVWGYKYEKYPNSYDLTYFFGEYYLLTGVTKAISTQTITQYDAADISKHMTDVTAYQRSSPAHKLVSKIVNTKADGTVYADYFRYPADYGTIPSGADAASQMIGQLQTSFMNGVLIEHYSTVDRGGDEYVTGGSVTGFNSFGLSSPVPEHVYTWRSAGAFNVSGFVPSYVHPSTKAFTLDGGYENVKTFLSYDTYANPTGSVDESNQPKAVAWSDVGSVPVITLDNATLSQAAFSNFEQTTPISFTLVNNSIDYPNIVYSTGRIGTKSVYPEIKLSKQLNKGYSQYIFSGWWNKVGPSLSMTVLVKNTAQTTTYYSSTVSILVDGSSSAWKYFEIKIPIDPALSDFYIEITPNGSPSDRLDDLALYPANATLTSTTYAYSMGVSSVTTGNQTVFTEYDNLGRTRYIRDRDRKILERRTYEYTTPVGNKYPIPSEL